MNCDTNQGVGPGNAGRTGRVMQKFAPTLLFPLLLIVLIQLLSACAQDTQDQVDPYALYRVAVKPEFQQDFDLLSGAPHYALDVTLDPSGTFLTGMGRIAVTNYTGDPWRNLVFRLYPAMTQYGGRMTIQSVLVDGQAVAFVYLANNSAVRIDLPAPLLSERAVVVQIAWRLDIPTWSDTATIYALFGRSQSMISLPLFYPSLAVYEPGPTLGSGGWWLDTGSVRGDAAYNVASLFVVTATLPAEQVPVTSGTLVTSTAVMSEAGEEGGENAESAEMTRYVWVTGPVREFVLHMSPLFNSATMDTYGTRVTSYWLPGQEAAGRNALRYAVAALRIFSDYFGEYPFTDMQVAPAPISFRGMEYPQVNLVGVELYTTYQNSMEILIAHEVAHQWWYQIVHNDPVNTPWLDEALAEYAVKLYYEGLRGDSVAGQLQRQRWLTPVTLLAQQGQESAIDRPVRNFESGTQYETVVYGRGALFYDTMRNILGERPFRRFLRDYLERYRYDIVTTADWLEMIRELENQELLSLYEDWVSSPESSLYTRMLGVPVSGGPVNEQAADGQAVEESGDTDVEPVEE